MTEPTPEPAETGADSVSDTGSGSGSDTETTATDRRYADRYGIRERQRRTPRRGFVLGLVAAVVLAGLGVAYLAWSQFGPEDIESEQLGYTVIDDSTIELRVRLTRADPSVPVVCMVRAMSGDIVEIGRREVLVQPSPHGTVKFDTLIRTSERPSSAAVYTCTDRVPAYLRTE